VDTAAEISAAVAHVVYWIFGLWEYILKIITQAVDNIFILLSSRFAFVDVLNTGIYLYFELVVLFFQPCLFRFVMLRFLALFVIFQTL
jgi:hypothetical protein